MPVRFGALSHIRKIFANRRQQVVAAYISRCHLRDGLLVLDFRRRYRAVTGQCRSVDVGSLIVDNLRLQHRRTHDRNTHGSSMLNIIGTFQIAEDVPEPKMHGVRSGYAPHHKFPFADNLFSEFHSYGDSEIHYPSESLRVCIALPN